MNLIDGKALSAKWKENLKLRIDALSITTPHLAIIKVGNNPASESYVKSKKKQAEELEIKCTVYELFETAEYIEVLNTIDTLNRDKDVHGIILQLPLPGNLHLSEDNLTNCIKPEKDVDGLTNYSKLMLYNNMNSFKPCTPLGIVELLKSVYNDLTGKYVVIVGRSNLVGKPLSLMLQNLNCTVTLCHSKTKHLTEICRNAEIVVCAIGKPKFFTKEYFSFRQTVIDVGINRDENGKLVGDVDFENVKDIVNYITPVPGGVGPMTVCMLLNNVVSAAEIEEIS